VEPIVKTIVRPSNHALEQYPNGLQRPFTCDDLNRLKMGQATPRGGFSAEGRRGSRTLRRAAVCIQEATGGNRL